MTNLRWKLENSSTGNLPFRSNHASYPRPRAFVTWYITNICNFSFISNVSAWDDWRYFIIIKKEQHRSVGVVDEFSFRKQLWCLAKFVCFLISWRLNAFSSSLLISVNFPFDTENFSTFLGSYTTMTPLRCTHNFRFSSHLVDVARDQRTMTRWKIYFMTNNKIIS